MDNAPRTPAAPAAPGPLASFVRFVVCGGGVGVLSSFAVTLLALSMPWGLANAVITVASTLLCTELHARFTFGAGRRADRREHWQSAGSAAVAYVVTCAAMLLLHLVQSSPSALTEQVVYLGASALAGLGRFLVLRLFVFAAGRGSGRTAEPVVREYVPAGVSVGGRHGSPGCERTAAAVLTARRPCPGPSLPRPRRQSARSSGSTRNALCRLNGRTARKSGRPGVSVASATVSRTSTLDGVRPGSSQVRENVDVRTARRPGSGFAPGHRQESRRQESRRQASRTLLSLSE